MKVRLTGQGPSESVTAGNTDGTLTFTHVSTHGLVNWDIIQIQQPTLPTGISAGTNYFVINADTDTFQLAPSASGSAISYTNSGSGTATFTSSWGNLVNDASSEVSNLNGTKDVYVVASTSGFFKISDTDSGVAYEIKLRTGESSPNVNVLLSRPRYKAGTDIIFEQFLAGSATSIGITGDDVGRLIRINPLARPLEALGGIRWAWGIIKAVSADEVPVTLKTEICNTRENTVANNTTKGTPWCWDGFPIKLEKK